MLMKTPNPESTGAGPAPLLEALPQPSLLEENNRLSRELAELRAAQAGERAETAKTVKRLVAQGLELAAKLEVIESNPLVMVLPVA